jgi:hypothetical protein
LARSYDPHRLSSPRVHLLSMMIFLIIVGFLAAILYRQIATAFITNPGLNGLIFGVLGVGMLLIFMQVFGLMRFRGSHPDDRGNRQHDPVTGSTVW